MVNRGETRRPARSRGADLKRVVSQADAAEMIPTENRQMRPSCGLGSTVREGAVHQGADSYLGSEM
jgi:hypothetical protein